MKTTQTPNSNLTRKRGYADESHSNQWESLPYSKKDFAAQSSRIVADEATSFKVNTLLNLTPSQLVRCVSRDLHKDDAGEMLHEDFNPGNWHVVSPVDDVKRAEASVINSFHPQHQLTLHFFNSVIVVIFRSMEEKSVTRSISVTGGYVY